MKKPHFILLFYLFFTGSCIEEVDLDKINRPTSQRLVVEGTITDEQKAHMVKLSRTNRAIPKGAALGVLGAKVTITDGTTSFLLQEVDTLPGIYLTDNKVQGEIGKTYTLTITLEGELYTAAAIMEPSTPFEPVENLFASPNRLYYGIENNFEVLEWQFPKVRYGALAPAREVLVTQDPVQPQNTIQTFFYDFPGIDPDGFLLNFSGSDRSLFIQEGSVITQYKYSLSKEHYGFIRAMYSETQFKGGVFDRIPGNVPTNINNGALGFFGASSAMSRSFVVTKELLGQ
jgi:hypothetical protein